MHLKIKEEPLLHGREHGGVVSRGKEKAVYNLIFFRGEDDSYQEYTA